MKKMLIILSFILCITGCNPYDVEEILLSKEEISLTVKGELMLSYDPHTFQLGYNADRNEFRVHDDNIGNWFTLRCDVRPAVVGEVIEADLSWTTANTIKNRRGLEFRIEKTDAEGHIWLWCKEEAIGVVVKEF